MINNSQNKNSKPSPSVIEAILIAEVSGIQNFADAIDYYVSHYDMFFDLENIEKQMSDFKNELIKQGFIDKENNFIEITVSAALKKMNYGLPLPHKE